MKNLEKYVIVAKELGAITGGAKPEDAGKREETGKPAWAGTGKGRLGKGKGTPGTEEETTVA